MIGFLVIALVLAALACLWLFLPLFGNRGGKDDAPEHEQVNLQILRDQWEELENDYRTGAIGEAELTEAKAELERRTLEEAALQKAAVKETRQKKPAIIWSVAGALAVLCVAGVLYSVVGTPSAFDPGKATVEASPHDSPHDFSAEQMEEMLNAFAARLEAEPDNIKGRLMLARSYIQVGKYLQAAATYEKILDRIPDDADVLADYADLLAVMQDGRLGGRPMELVGRALKANPAHWKALALAGTYAFENQDYARAEAYWVKLRETAPPGSEIARSIDGSIAEARARAGKASDVLSPFGAPAVRE